MKTLAYHERRSNQLAKRAVLLLGTVVVTRKFMFGSLLTICVLLQTGCHSAHEVPERTKKLLEESKVNVLLELPGYAGHKAPGVGALIFTDNRHLCSAGDEIFRMYDIYANNKEINTFPIGGLGSGMYFLPSRKTLIIAGYTNLKYMQDFDKSPRINEFRAPPPFSFLTFSNGMAVFHDVEDTGILLVDVTTKQTWTFPPPDKEQTVITAAYSPKGKFLVAGCNGGVLWRWDLGDKRATLRYSRSIGPPIPGLESPNDGCPINRLVVSPDGTNIVTASYDKVIRLLNAADGSVIKKLDSDAHGASYNLLYSNDGKMLISIEAIGHMCQPGLIRFWDVGKGSEICPPYVGHKYAICSCCLSPDNSLLATGSGDGSILVWKVPSLTPKKEKGGKP